MSDIVMIKGKKEKEPPLSEAEKNTIIIRFTTKEILTDIRDYLNGLLAEWNGTDIHLESICLVEKQLVNLTEYAKKLGVEL